MTGEATTASRPWLDAYPADLPALFEPRHRDMVSLFVAAAAEGGKREALDYFGTGLSYAELDAHSDAFASWLGDRAVAAGDRIGIVLQNVPFAVVAMIGAWKCGAIPVPSNPMYRPAELSRIFRDSAPKVVLCHDDHIPTVSDALALAGLGEVPVVTVSPHDLAEHDEPRLLPRRGAHTDGDDTMLSICAGNLSHRPPRIAPGGDDIAVIVYTSGTTGEPKGATITHASLAFSAQVGARWMKLDAGSRILGLAPLFHITGFVLHMAAAMAAGCSLALHYRFGAEAVIDIIRRYRPTSTVAAITAYNALMNVPGVGAAEFASFGHMFTGGAPVAPALRDQVRDRLGVSLLPAYGMTETCGPTHICPPGRDVPVDPTTGALSIGLPLSSTEACVTTETGEPLPPGAIGEIRVRGPQVMTGYWHKPTETADVLHHGWLRTGDIGVVDERGWFYVVDRQKDMIVASGFKVWPREVEDLLIAHPAVREAGVIGVPDAYRGETVHAYVSLVAGAGAIDAADLTRFCRDRLAAYKVPRQIVVIEDLPKTPTGKIQRMALRDLTS